MADLPADIQPDVIRPLLTGSVGRDLRVLAEADSTNDVVMEAGQQGEPEGLAVLADRQMRGRGRAGRSWASPPGVGIYTSILLRPRLKPAECARIPLLVGLAVAEAIEAVTGCSPALKWPNDLLLDKRKVAGVLMEMASRGTEVSHLCVGIGINVLHTPEDFPVAVRDFATSLRMATGRGVHRGALTAAVYNALDRRYAACVAGGPDWLGEVRRRMPMLGHAVAVHAVQRVWAGTALDIDADGALLVEDEGHAIRRVFADEVMVRN